MSYRGTKHDVIRQAQEFFMEHEAHGAEGSWAAFVCDSCGLDLEVDPTDSSPRVVAAAKQARTLTGILP